MRSQNNQKNSRRHEDSGNYSQYGNSRHTYESGRWPENNYKRSGYQSDSDRRGNTGHYPEDSQGYRDYERQHRNSERNSGAYSYPGSRDKNDGAFDNYDRMRTDERRYGQDTDHNNYNDSPGRNYGSDRSEYGLNSGSYNANTGRRYNSDYDERRDYQNEGYAGRNASDYNSRSYGDDHFYNPADDYENGSYHYARDNNYTNYYRAEENLNRQRNNSRGSGSDYGYYESYPPSGQSTSYNDHEKYSGKRGQGYKSYVDTYGEVDYDNDNRPNIRDRRSF